MGVVNADFEKELDPADPQCGIDFTCDDIGNHCRRECGHDTPGKRLSQTDQVGGRLRF